MTPYIFKDGKVGERDVKQVWDSWLQGTVECSYQDLVDTFGMPNDNGDTEKCDANWFFMSTFGAVSIYNWKDGKNYLGAEGADVEDITDWHIGGKESFVVGLVRTALERNKKMALTRILA